MTPDELRQRSEAHTQRQPARSSARPPAETGERIGTIERGPDEQVRVNWCLWDGKPYVSLRLWKRSSDGSWWPDARRGMSVRIRELGALGEALAAAMDKAEASSTATRATNGGPAPARGGSNQGNGLRGQGGAPGRPGGAEYVPRGRERRSWDRENIPPAQPAGADPHFDEFEDGVSRG